MDSPFDSQAATFDQRAGLSEGVGYTVAQAVLELAEVQPGDVVHTDGCNGPPRASKRRCNTSYTACLPPMRASSPFV